MEENYSFGGRGCPEREEDAGELEMDVDAGAQAKPPAKGKAKARRGRKTVRFEKCSWVEVSARPQALTWVTRFWGSPLLWF